MSQIRPVNDADLWKVAELGKGFWATGALPGKLDPEHFRQVWSSLIAQEIGQIFGMWNGEDLEGVLGVTVHPDPNDGELVANEQFWWVEPEARGNGVRLLQAFEAWAHERGCTRLMMVHLIDLTPEKLEKLYTRMGYRKVEVHYMKEI